MTDPGSASAPAVPVWETASDDCAPAPAAWLHSRYNTRGEGPDAAPGEVVSHLGAGRGLADYAAGMDLHAAVHFVAVCANRRAGWLRQPGRPAAGRGAAPTGPSSTRRWGANAISSRSTCCAAAGTFLRSRWPGREHGPYDYLISVNRWPKRFELFPCRLREPLLCITIPLRDTDADAVLDLQQLLEQVYDEGGYMLRVLYDQPREPRLRNDDQRWATERWAAYRACASGVVPAASDAGRGIGRDPGPVVFQEESLPLLRLPLLRLAFGPGELRGRHRGPTGGHSLHSAQRCRQALKGPMV